MVDLQTLRYTDRHKNWATVDWQTETHTEMYTEHAIVDGHTDTKTDTKTRLEWIGKHAGRHPDHVHWTSDTQTHAQTGRHENGQIAALRSSGEVK